MNEDSEEPIFILPEYELAQFRFFSNTVAKVMGGEGRAVWEHPYCGTERSFSL